ncbi:MAG: Periplasmic beta-glucosidase [Chloroflexi bacterium AL-W]|nr:Periplasmic beta-glucosidase [Chloroflexi bacterium AL-N1]NOK64630.1 Periplasmic beta-glucosidase [Chloroflexi bacterium AL-N10]NOK75871.1 Periplasmic beta-glucosidase [Chloroflexi bacterium AL-N5]NOK80371.1 Periplasmic beta-glucosidase [Chloroflexi bacterium AL-W]NOK86884.1 Periplasmic beta-glucosidase [Chloroflexi bacterium AL-N15]
MQDIDQLVEAMTLEEKATLCTGSAFWVTAAIERLDISAIVLSDGPHGVRRSTDVNEMMAEHFPATCFPTASALAATWNTALLHEIGQTLGEEAIALNVDVLLGPGVNMKRSPRCGRNFEYFAEDPFIAGEMGAALAEGVQSKGVGTSLKHFAANNQETRRFTINAIVDERTLHEIYLPAFETVVKRAKPWTVMCAYNRLNGPYCSEHHELLVDILKQAWGFEGVVVSDWGAVHDRVAALRGGLDLEMPGPKARRVQSVIEAVQRNELDEAVLDESVRRILRIVKQATATPKGGTFDVAKHHALARRAAGEAIVLLKNDGVLPLQQPSKIAVIGRSAKQPQYQGGGSSHITATRVDIPFDELQKQAGDATLSYSEGYPAGAEFDQKLIDEAVAAAQAVDVALLYVALPGNIESEGYDRNDIALTEQQIALIKAVCTAQPQTVVILNSGSVMAMSAWIDGAGAVLQAWFMGQAGGGAIADVLFGAVNPSGKLTETFPLRLADTPSHINFPGNPREVHYGEGIFIGYRYYETKDIPVLFPFGHGLSYTTFDYSNLQTSATLFDDVDGLTISVDVTNTGTVAGQEIVQCYVRDVESGLMRPDKELKGFAKVALDPGETKTVTMKLDFRAFAYYHPLYKQWITEDGEFEILVGASSADIRLQTTVSLRSTVMLPSLLNRESTGGDWLSDPRGQAVVAPLLEQMLGAFNGEEHENGGLNMDTRQMFLQVSLLGMLEFQEGALPASPDEIVDGLLAQVHENQTNT